MTLETIKIRADFIRARKAQRAARDSLIVEACARPAPQAEQTREYPSEDCIRVGFTCSKKVGNAVHRNRTKRRLRAAAMAIVPEVGKNGWDYVIIGRATTAQMPFEKLKSDISAAIIHIHTRKPRPKAKSGKRAK